MDLGLAAAKVVVQGGTQGMGRAAARELRHGDAQGMGRRRGNHSTDLYAIMAGIDEHFGHPAHLPRAGDPEEIGPVIAFAAVRRNSYMTGANINVDGGSDFT